MVDFQDILARVTIKDILTDCGYNPASNRMPCPIHGGKNPTSFSFTDHGYCCFSCGASGGMLDLSEALRGINREQALKYLADLAGIQIDDRPCDNTSRINKAYRRTPAITDDTNLINLKIDHKALEILSDHYTWRIRNARKCLKVGTMDLATYYAETQYAEYALEELDKEIAIIKHEITMKNKEINYAYSIGNN